MTNHSQNDHTEIIREDGSVNEARLSRRLIDVLDMLETAGLQQGEAAGILADLSTQVEVVLKEKERS